jgi:hypothetical protein
MKYRKKPVVIEAIQYKGVESFPELAKFMDDEFLLVTFKPASEQLVIPTLEGDHIANVGDWIIKGVKGEFYPCKPDIFAETYEKVTE